MSAPDERFWTRDPDPEAGGWTPRELRELHHDWGTVPVARTRGRAPWEEDVPGAHPSAFAGDDGPGPGLSGKREAGEPLTGWARTPGPGPLNVPGEDIPALAPYGDEPDHLWPGSIPGPALPGAGPGPEDDPINTEEDAKRWVARRLEEAWAKSYIVRLWWQQREAL